MTMFLAPYTAIADIDGSPLDAGFLYLGEYGKDPASYPVEVFWDADFTTPAAQPIRTRNGYPVRNGSPAKVYLKTAQHSIAIKNRKGAFVLVDFYNKGWDASFVVDSSGRNQQEINDERISIAAFGKPTGDDWTDVIHSAVPYGKPIHFPMGVYKIRKDRFLCGGNSILFYGDKGAKIVMVDGSDSSYVFDGSNSERIVINGFEISSETASTNNRMFWFNEISYVKELNFDYNSISGHSQYAFGVGSLSQDPFVTYFGFDSISIKYNDIKNAHDGVLTLGNFPVKLMVTSNNTIRNFGGSLFSNSVHNSATNGDKLMQISEFIGQDNIVTTDTDYWSTSSGLYITVLLCEGRKATWKGNSIEGVKSREGKSLCDAYLSTRIVIRDSNDVRNIGNFSDSEQNRNIFHFKNDASSGVVPQKSINKDTFIVDRYWLSAIGETDCVYRLANFGLFNGGDVSIKDCTIKVPTLASNNRNNLQSFVSSGNTIEADKIYLRPSEVSFRVWDFGLVAASDNRDNYVTVKNETVTVKDLLGSTAIYVNSQGSVKAHSLQITQNEVSLYNSAGINWLYGHIVASARITDNTVNGVLYRDFYSCKFDKLESKRNIFSDPSLATVSISPLDSPAITVTGVQEHSYQMKPRPYRLKVFSPVESGIQRKKYKLVFKTVDGVDTLEFKLLVDNTAGAKKVTLNTPEDVSTEVLEADALSSPVAIKVNIVSDSVVTPAYSAQIIKTGGNLVVQVIGVSGFESFDLETDVFQVP